MFRKLYGSNIAEIILYCLLWISQIVHISPCASELPGLVPHLLQQRVVLHNDGVLYEGALGRGGRVAVVHGGGHAAAAEGDVERGLGRKNRYLMHEV